MRTTAGEWSVARGIVEGVGALNESAQRAGVLGSVGLVIGATVGGAVAELGITEGREVCCVIKAVQVRVVAQRG